MEKTLMRLFSLSRHPILAVRDGRVVFANGSAEEFFGEKLMTRMASEILPQAVLQLSGDYQLVTVTICGRRTSASVTALEETLLICLSSIGKKVEEIVPSAIVSNLRESLFNMRLSAEQMLGQLKKTGDNKLSSYSSIFYHNYFTMLRTLGSIDTMNALLAGEMVFMPTVTDVAKLCAELVDSVVHVIKGHGACLTFTCSEEVIAAVDAEKLEQMLLNLLSNSLLHTPEEGKIEVSLRTEGSNFVLSVDDNGRGLSSSVMSSIFRRFEYGVDLSNACKGIGLGLSVAKGITELHGGVLLLSSREGEGTSARALIPMNLKPSVRFSDVHTQYRASGMNMVLTELSTYLGSDCYYDFFGRYLD